MKKALTAQEKQAIIESILEGYLTYGKSYHSPLPPKLNDWYAYTCDGGHCICCVLKQHYTSDVDLSDFLVPISVKAVLRNHEIKGNYVIVDLPYDEDVGVTQDEEDYEFDQHLDCDQGPTGTLTVSFIAQDGKRIWDNAKPGRPMAADGMKSESVVIVLGGVLREEAMAGCGLQLTVGGVPAGSEEDVIKMLKLLPVHGMPDFWRIMGPVCACAYDQLRRYALKPTLNQHG